MKVPASRREAGIYWQLISYTVVIIVEFLFPVPSKKVLHLILQFRFFDFHLK